jgi:hypothetical protein
MYKIGNRLSYKKHTPKEKLYYTYIIVDIVAGPTERLIVISQRENIHRVKESLVEGMFEIVPVRKKRTCKLPEWF